MGWTPSIINALVIILVIGFFFISTARVRSVSGAVRIACAIVSAVTGVVAAVWALLEKVWKPFGGATPAGIYVAGWAFVLIVGCTVMSLVSGGRIVGRGDQETGGRWGRKDTWVQAIGACVAVVFGSIACINVVNNSFALYPSVNSLVGPDSYTTAQYKDVQGHATPLIPPHGGTIAHVWRGAMMRNTGVLVPFMIPTPVSHFQTTTAQVYLPPAYFANPRPLLPVIVLMNGLPGTASQWFDLGNAGEALHNFERAHRGLAPVIVAINTTGNGVQDLGCFDTDKNKVQTYMDTDVPQQIQRYFQVSRDPQQWAIGGLSYGGTCAFQAVVNNPRPYRYFLDFSGARTPGALTAQANADTYFGGNLQAYQRVNPEDILNRRRFSGIKGLFISGEADTSSGRDLRYMNRLARKSGIESSFHEVPGAHDFGAWRRSLVFVLPRVAREMKLIG